MSSRRILKYNADTVRRHFPGNSSLPIFLTAILAEKSKSASGRRHGQKTKRRSRDVFYRHLKVRSRKTESERGAARSGN